jgi:hypothetical protein
MPVYHHKLRQPGNRRAQDKPVPKLLSSSHHPLPVFYFLPFQTPVGIRKHNSKTISLRWQSSGGWKILRPPDNIATNIYLS